MTGGPILFLHKGSQDIQTEIESKERGNPGVR